MSDVITKPGTTRVFAIQAPRVPDSSVTVATSVMTFPDIKHLLADKPLRRPSQRWHGDNQTAQDRDDIAAIDAAKSDGLPLPYDELRQELGLTAD